MTDKLQQAQENVEEVRELMQENYMKVHERGEKLEDLEAQADELAQKAMTFERMAVQVKKNCKKEEKKTNGCLKVIAAIVLLVIVVAIIIAIVTMYNTSAGGTTTAAAAEERNTEDKGTGP